jgi:hypothetical protein
MSWIDPLEPDDALSQLLTDWRNELDAHAGTVMTTELPALPGRSRRWVRAHQRTAAATAIVVALAGTTTVAAAATGSSGPLGGVHDFLYGKPGTPPVDYTAIEIRALLGRVGAAVREAQQAGSIKASVRDRLTGDLDQAQSLLDGDASAPAALGVRVTELRAALAAIPTATAPSSDSHHRSHGADNTPGDDQSGAAGDEGQGNAGGQGDDRGGSQGSDDGNQDGDGGDSGGDGSGGGGDQGSESGNSSDVVGPGTSSDDGASSDGSDDRSDDGGSVSGGGDDDGSDDSAFMRSDSVGSDDGSDESSSGQGSSGDD